MRNGFLAVDIRMRRYSHISFASPPPDVTITTISTTAASTVIVGSEQYDSSPIGQTNI